MLHTLLKAGRPRFFSIKYNVSRMTLANLRRTFAYIIFPIPVRNSLKNFKSKTIALSATLNIACHKSKNKSKVLSSVQSTFDSFCSPHKPSMSSTSSEYSKLCVSFYVLSP